MRKEANKLKIEAQIDLENFEEKMNEYASENKETEA